MVTILQETAESLGEHEMLGAPWREAHGDPEAIFESPEYAAAAGGGGGRGVAAAAARAAFSPRSVAGVPLADIYGGVNRDFLDPEQELGMSGPPLSPSLLMEHFGHRAVLAESDAEADAFIFPLIPLAAKLLAPRILPLLSRAIPRLARGAVNVMRTLRRNPATRALVRTIPSIVRRTVRRLGRLATRVGGPVSPGVAARVLAQQTQRVIGAPQVAAQTIRRARTVDRHYHVICRRVAAPTLIP